MSLVDIDLEKIFEKRESKYCRFKKFGIKYIDYKIPRRYSGNSVKYQKRVAQAIKRARHLALLPFVADNLK